MKRGYGVNGKGKERELLCVQSWISTKEWRVRASSNGNEKWREKKPRGSQTPTGLSLDRY
jgi:hypothetical protein